MSADETPGSATGMLAAIERVTGGREMFGGLDAPARAAIEAESEWVLLQSGGELFRQGDPGDALHVLIAGRLRVLVETAPGATQAVAEIGRGEVVGEMALLTGDPRSATVVAVRDSQLVRLSKRSFERIMEQCPQAMLQVTRRIVRRLQQMNAAPRPQASLATIALVPLGPDVPLRSVAERFVQSLQQMGSAVLVTRELAEQQAGEANAAGTDTRLGAWLDSLELNHTYVVYLGDFAAASWTDRCARQADRLLLVANAAADPAADAVALSRHLEAFAARRDLVLLHPATTLRPSGTVRWLDGCQVATFHHVRDAHPADIDRLVRLLTGRAVGLVLGGGGARGFAHIGVIRALEEAGIPIDAIGGTSMGAVIAAQYAAGADAAALRRLNRLHWVQHNPLRDKTLPVVALLTGGRLERMIGDMFGDVRIEDLWTKYFCVSADLTLAEMRVHGRGHLGRAVRASMSLPGIAIPVHDSGSMLVDGGLLNNLPADVMRATCGKVIAVDVSPAKDLAIAAPYPASASGWRLLWSRRASKLPGIGAILMRSVMLSSTRHQNSIAREVDLYLRPPVDGFGMFDWKAVDEIADAAYQFTRDTLSCNPPLLA